jgi:ribonuclease HI
MLHTPEKRLLLRDDNAAPWVIHCDGSAVPNPGRMGLGAVVVEPDGATRHALSEATHLIGCNNEAELRALLLGLRRVLQLAPRPAHPVQVFSDNSVLVAQLAGDDAMPPIARLADLFDQARAQLAACGDVHVHWIPRHRNGEADALARAALGLAPKASTPHRLRKKNNKKHPRA